MLQQRLTAARKVADQLFTAEDAFDAAISELAMLSATMSTNRKEAGLAACVVQDALVETAAANQMLMVARGKLMDAHKRLAEAQKNVGLGAVNFGGGPGKPPAPLLQAVEAEAA